jgi:hypothetical protein
VGLFPFRHLPPLDHQQVWYVFFCDWNDSTELTMGWKDLILAASDKSYVADVPAWVSCATVDAMGAGVLYLSYA